MSQLLIKINNLVKPVSNYDWISKNDLFVLIRYGSQWRRTNVKWDDNNPEWNEKFLFDLNNEFEEIDIELYDENVWSSVKNISKTTIPVEHGEIKQVVAGVIMLEMGDPFQELYKTIKNDHKIIREQTQIVDAQKTQIETQELMINGQKEQINLLTNRQNDIIKILSI